MEPGLKPGTGGVRSRPGLPAISRRDSIVRPGSSRRIGAAHAQLSGGRTRRRRSPDGRPASARAVRALAEKINADIVVYGSLGENHAVFVPEIFIANRELA